MFFFKDFKTMDLSTIKSRIRSLVDDPDASYATDAFLLPLVNQKYEELYNRMLSTGAEFERRLTELLNVPAQTPNLSAYALPGQPLELMVQPLQFEWKQAGLDPTNYKTASLVDKVKDVIPGQIIDDWEWRAGVIYFTPCTLAVDIRNRGDQEFWSRARLWHSSAGGSRPRQSGLGAGLHAAAGQRLRRRDAVPHT